MLNEGVNMTQQEASKIYDCSSDDVKRYYAIIGIVLVHEFCSSLHERIRKIIEKVN